LRAGPATHAPRSTSATGPFALDVVGTRCECECDVLGHAPLVPGAPSSSGWTCSANRSPRNGSPPDRPQCATQTMYVQLQLLVRRVGGSAVPQRIYQHIHRHRGVGPTHQIPSRVRGITAVSGIGCPPRAPATASGPGTAYRHPCRRSAVPEWSSGASAAEHGRAAVWGTRSPGLVGGRSPAPASPLRRLARRRAARPVTSNSSLMVPVSSFRPLSRVPRKAVGNRRLRRCRRWADRCEGTAGHTGASAGTVGEGASGPRPTSSSWE